MIGQSTFEQRVAANAAALRGKLHPMAERLGLPVNDLAETMAFESTLSDERIAQRKGENQ